MAFKKNTVSKKKAKKTSTSQVGKFGDVIFTVSSNKIFTFSNLKQTVSAQWGSNKVIGTKPKSEFLGAGLRSVRMDITLDVMLGVKPRKMIKTLEKMVESGAVEYLVIGKEKIGKYKFCIKSMSESWDVIYSKGELAKATVSLTLEEYL